MPGSIKEFVEGLSDTPPGVVSCFLSMIVAYLRVACDNKESSRTRRALESLLCGGITFSLWKLTLVIGWPEDIAVFLGGMIGLLGSDYIRTLARKTINKKADQLVD